jgi:hypothetical protein
MEKNSEMSWKLWKKIEKRYEDMEENSEKIGKIWKKIVK